MRLLALGSGIIAVAFALDARSAAQAAGWCAQYFNGGTTCGFSSFAQCQAAVRGAGGYCSQDPAGGSIERSQPPKNRSEAKPKRAPETKPVAIKPRNKSTPQPDAAEPPKPVAPAPAVVQTPQAQPIADSFAAARALILSGKYELGIAAMRSGKLAQQGDVRQRVAPQCRQAARCIQTVERHQRRRQWHMR